jgi:putative ABC transport system permease protein
VASLLLARGASRQTEIAVRAAMGAGRSRILRTLLTEHLLLAAIGGAAGVMLTLGGVAAVRALAPAELPSREQIVIDWRVLGFVVVASAIAGLLAGVLPASIGARTPLSEVLKAGGRSSTHGGAGRKARSALVVFELAMSVVLLTGAGLVALSFWKLQQVDLGFSADHLLTAEITVSLPNDRSQGKYVAPAPRIQFFEEILRRLQALPGVTHVAGAAAVPLRDDAADAPIGVEGRPSVPVGQLPQAVVRRVTTSYFDAMRTKIVRGQSFTEQDRMGMPLNVVISEAMARQVFPGEDPVGKRIKRGPAEGQGPWMTVVGVARDARLRSADQDPEATIYLSMMQAPSVTMAMLVRTAQDPGAIAPQIAQVVHSIDPDQPVYRVATMESVVTAAMGQRRFAALLLLVFAALSLALAAVGVYGLIAQSVASRRREIGVRMAVGADASAVLRLIVWDAMSLAALGTVLGLGLSLVLMRFLSSQLFEVSARDPLVLGIVAPVLLVVAAAAAWGPGLSAAKLSPVTALRSD